MSDHDREAGGTCAEERAAQAVDDLPLFREAALRARVEQSQDFVRGPRLAEWSVLLVLLSFSVVAGALLCLARVEVTTAAFGALRAENGPRPIVAQVPGRVTSLSIVPGTRVVAGQELARVDAPELISKLERLEAEYRHVKADTDVARGGSLTAEQDIVRALERKRALLMQRARLLEGTVEHRRQHESAAKALAEAGAGRALDVTDAAIARRQTQQELLLVREQVAEIEVELAQRRKSNQDERLGLSAKLTSADSDLRETRALLELAAVRAPEAGTVESLLVSEGQVVTSGTTLARVVPDGPLQTLVVFAPAKDAPFLREGLTANVELSGLPAGEFGKLKARIKRVSKDLASPSEQAEVLGSDAGGVEAVRVELELEGGSQLDRVRGYLTSGARGVARLSTRRVRLIVLLFDFARRWVEA